MSVGMHTDPLDMVGYVRGSLSQECAAEVREHCFACRECGDQLAAVILLRRAAPLPAPAPWYWSRPVAAAAAVVLLVGAGAWLATSGAEVPNAGVIDDRAVATRSPERAGRAVLADRDYLEVTPTDVGIMSAIAFLLDGVGAPSSAVIDGGADAGSSLALREGVRALGEARYAEAAGYLEEFGNRYHPTGTVLLGMALFFDGRSMSAARQALENHVSKLQDSDDEWSTEARAGAYYLARLHIQADERAAARALLSRASQRDGSGSDRVQGAVNQLLLELD